MPRRSAIITVSNNTDRDLILTKAECWHGDWTNDIPPPSTIPRKTCGSWEAESAGTGTGTEGVVVYQISNPEPGKAPDEAYIISSPLLVQCRPELATISWHNPFVWASDTTPIGTSVVATDAGTKLPTNAGTNPPGCAHELFVVSQQVNDNAKITWWDAIVWHPIVLVETLRGNEDIHLEYTFGLRLKGSVAQTRLATPCVSPPQDIRTLSRKLGQPSLRKLFHM